MEVKVGDWVKFRYWKTGQFTIAEVESVTPLGGLDTNYGLLREDTILEVRHAGQDRP